MRNIKAASITLLLSFAVIFSCFSGCGEEIYDLTKLANEGIPIASVLIYDGTTHYAVITDGGEYLKVITLTGYTQGATTDMTVDTRGNFHIYNDSTIYTYKRDGSYSVSSAFTNIYGIATGNNTVYAMVDIGGTYYIYSYNSNTSQWSDTGTNLASITQSFIFNCLARDNASGNAYITNFVTDTSTYYSIPSLEMLGSVSCDNGAFYSVYNHEGFVFSPTYGIYSTERGFLASLVVGLHFTVMNSDNIFIGDGSNTIFRYNTVKGLTSKTVSLPHSASAYFVPLDGSRIIVGEYGATTCDIVLYNYDTDMIERTIYSYPNTGATGALFLRVYR